MRDTQSERSEKQLFGEFNARKEIVCLQKTCFHCREKVGLARTRSVRLLAVTACFARAWILETSLVWQSFSAHFQRPDGGTEYGLWDGARARFDGRGDGHSAL